MALDGERSVPSHDYVSPASKATSSAMSAIEYPRLTRAEQLSLKLPPAYINALCGASGGIASGIVTCPLDVIKTKLQAHGGSAARRNGRPPGQPATYKGLVGTARTIWMEDGLRGMYRGLTPMLLGYLPTWAVFLTVYDKCRQIAYSKTDNRWLAHLGASVSAGACSTMVTNPIWVIKTRLMSQVSGSQGLGFSTPWHYSSTLDAARKIYRNEGFLAFYSGLTPALLGLTHVAVQFPLYEFFKMQFTGQGLGEEASEGNDTHWVGIFSATLLSKLCASCATYPHEVIRTRLQTQQRSLPSESHEGITFRGGKDHPTDYGRPPGPSSSDGMRNPPRYRGVIRTCKIMLQEEGWQAFYNGMGTNLIRAVPAAMTTMMTYEFLKGSINRLQARAHRKLDSQKDAIDSS